MAVGTRHGPREQTFKMGFSWIAPSEASRDLIAGGGWSGDNLWYAGLQE